MKISFFIFLTLISCLPDPFTSQSETPSGQPNPRDPFSSASGEPLTVRELKEVQRDKIWCECLENGVSVWNKQLNQKVHIVMVLKEVIDGEVKTEKSYSQQDLNNRCQEFTKELVDFGDVSIVSLDQVRSEDIQQCEKIRYEHKPD